MLVNFDPPGICLHDGGSICLVPADPFYRYFRFGGIDLLVPRIALGELNPTWHQHINPSKYLPVWWTSQ